MSITLFGKRPWLPSALGQSLLAWHEADFSALRQDCLGTTPVTGLEQPVGLVLDKSGNGNHDIQQTATARPETSSKYNLVLVSDDFSNAAWVANRGIYTPNYGISPDGTKNSFLVTEGTKYTAIYNLLPNQIYTISEYVRPHDNQPIIIYKDSGSFAAHATFDPVSELLITNTNTFLPRVEDCGNGWFRIWCSFQNNTDALATFHIFAVGSAEFYGFQVVAGVQPSRYQRVSSPTDYDSSGFVPYLRFGIDDEMVTTFSTAPGENCTIARAIPGVGAEILTQPIGTEFIETKSHAGRIIVNRGLTARETTYLTRYLNQKAGVMP